MVSPRLGIWPKACNTVPPIVSASCEEIDSNQALVQKGFSGKSTLLQLKRLAAEVRSTLSKVLSKVLKERGETMTVVDLKNGYERTINRCDSCGLVIAANGTDTGAIVGPWFGKVVCDDCLRAGIVYCSHCDRPHHKETPHKVVCAGCERVFTARIDYDGELCPLCIQAENGGVRINIYGALERY